MDITKFYETASDVLLPEITPRAERRRQEKKARKQFTMPVDRDESRRQRLDYIKRVMNNTLPRN